MKVSRCIFPVLLIVLFCLSQVYLMAEQLPEARDVYCSGEIVEIEVVGNGINAIYFRINNGYQGKSAVGLQGEVFADNTWAKLLGEFEVTEEFPGFCYAKMSKEMFPVEVGQAVRILVPEVDENPASVKVENVWGEVAEIEDAGAVKHIYIRIDEDQQVFSTGTIGEIYEDKTMEQLIGKLEILDEFPGFYYARIIEQNSAAAINQVVRFSRL